MLQITTACAVLLLVLSLANVVFSADKPPGRLGKTYRIMWDQNSGQESYYNPPMSPEKVAQAHFGFFEGTPVDSGSLKERPWMHMCAPWVGAPGTR